MSAPGARGIARRARRAFNLFFVDSGFGRNQLGEFRALRSATQGSALRTRSLSRKAGESFISPSGGLPENLFAIFCETVYNRTQMVLFLR